MADSNYLRDKLPPADARVNLGATSISHQQIKDVVISFYTDVGQDEYLSKAFANVDDWPHHFEIMTHFWWARLGGRAYLYYPYNPFKKHFENGFNAELLSRWLNLFEKSLTKHLDPQASHAWLLIAQAIGNNLLVKNNELLRMLNSK